MGDSRRLGWVTRLRWQVEVWMVGIVCDTGIKWPLPSEVVAELQLIGTLL